MKIINSLPPHNLEKDTWVSFDGEFFGMNLKQMHRPNGKFACLTICTGEDVYYIDDENLVDIAFSRIENCVWVAHKSDFDITQLRRFSDIKPRRKLWDTLYIERIMYNGFYEGFALDDLVRRWLDIELDKSLQKTFETATEMTPEMIEYACRDSYYTLQVAHKQHEVIDPDSFKVWKDIDCSAMFAVLDFQGFALDVDKWLSLARANKEMQTSIDAELPFNPRSHVQVKKWFREHGIELESSDEEHLSQVIKKNKSETTTKIAQMILNSRTYGKRASTYGENWIEDYVEYENGIPVIHSGYDVNRAETGRMASYDPNAQNIPIRDTPEFRECFIARPGNKIIVADYSAQEPRITAYFSQDKHMIDIFRQDKDIYIEMARDIFHENITKDDPRRKPMKSLVLGMNYLMSEYGLSSRENMSVEEARELIDQVFRIFPRVKVWIDGQRKKKKFVTTASGRKCWVNPYTDQSERNAVNAPVQGTAADMMKKAIGRLHRNWDWDYPFGVVGVIHDELILDVPWQIAEAVAEEVKQTMVEVAMEMCVGVPFKVDVSIGDRWSDKK